VRLSIILVLRPAFFAGRKPALSPVEGPFVSLPKHWLIKGFQQVLRERYLLGGLSANCSRGDSRPRLSGGAKLRYGVQRRRLCGAGHSCPRRLVAALPAEASWTEQGV